MENMLKQDHAGQKLIVMFKRLYQPNYEHYGGSIEALDGRVYADGLASAKGL